MHFTSWHDFLLLIALRYFSLAGMFWFCWYVVLKSRLAYKKIQLKFPLASDYRREILYSLSTMFIFSAFPAIMLLTPIRHYTLFYKEIPLHGNLYFWLAFPVMFVIHDTYFYFAHRLMHHQRVFKWIHLIHHRSTNPSPFAAFAFHPGEAFIEAFIFAILLVIMPLCKWHLLLFFLVQMIYNVYGHLGWEIYPKGFHRHWLGKWINTSLCHNQHHQYFTGNYGLYFLWWDRLFGTLRADYDRAYDELMNREKMK